MIYAPVGDGKTRILLLDFHIADRDATSPDLLLVWASSAEIPSGSVPYRDPRGERLSDGWHELVVKATEGYRSEYGP